MSTFTPYGEELQRVYSRLNESFTPEGGVEWLNSHSGYLNEKPIDVFERGEYERVYAALDALDEGAYL